MFLPKVAVKLVFEKLCLILEVSSVPRILTTPGDPPLAIHNCSEVFLPSFELTTPGGIITLVITTFGA